MPNKSTNNEKLLGNFSAIEREDCIEIDTEDMDFEATAEKSETMPRGDFSYKSELMEFDACWDETQDVIETEKKAALSQQQRAESNLLRKTHQKLLDRYKSATIVIPMDARPNGVAISKAHVADAPPSFFHSNSRKLPPLKVLHPAPSATVTSAPVAEEVVRSCTQNDHSNNNSYQNDFRNNSANAGTSSQRYNNHAQKKNYCRHNNNYRKGDNAQQERDYNHNNNSRKGDNAQQDRDYRHNNNVGENNYRQNNNNNYGTYNNFRHNRQFNSNNNINNEEQNYNDYNNTQSFNSVPCTPPLQQVAQQQKQQRQYFSYGRQNMQPPQCSNDLRFKFKNMREEQSSADCLTASRCGSPLQPFQEVAQERKFFRHPKGSKDLTVHITNKQVERSSSAVGFATPLQQSAQNMEQNRKQRFNASRFRPYLSHGNQNMRYGSQPQYTSDDEPISSRNKSAFPAPNYTSFAKLTLGDRKSIKSSDMFFSDSFAEFCELSKNPFKLIQSFMTEFCGAVEASKHKAAHNMNVQQIVHKIQNKSIIRVNGLTGNVIAENGPGIESVQVPQHSTDVSLSKRFS